MLKILKKSSKRAGPFLWHLGEVFESALKEMFGRNHRGPKGLKNAFVTDKNEEDGRKGYEDRSTDVVAV